MIKKIMCAIFGHNIVVKGVTGPEPLHIACDRCERTGQYTR